MVLRKLTDEEQAERDQLDKGRDLFMGVLEGVGWACLIAFCVFFAKQCGLIP